MEILKSLLPGRVSVDPLAAARDIAARRVVNLHGGIPFYIRPEWEGAEALSRMHQRSLHMHAFIGDLVCAYEQQRQRDWLLSALELVEDWSSRFEYPRDARSMAFHDETVARRLGYWLRLYFSLRAAGEQALADRMWQKINDIVWILNQDNFHAGLNNHGMFQDLALLYFCVCTPDAENIQAKSLKRLSDYFFQSVCRDGVHKEHSPAYHYLVADNIYRHRSLIERLDPTNAQALSELTGKMGRFGLNILTPDLQYPPLGDTQPVAPPSNYHKVFGLQYTTPDSAAFFFDGGFAVLRDDPEKREQQTYAVMCAGHHGDYHKHQDDLSVLLYAGEWILYESGPYGYDYAHPLSKHGYSAAAHSTLMLDDLQPSAETGRVALEESRETRQFVQVKGRNARYPGVDHERVMTVHRSKPLVDIADKVSSDAPHGMSLLWQLAPGLKAVTVANEVHLLKENIKVAKISVQSDAPVELTLGHGDQTPAGYVFPRLGEAKETTVLKVAAGKISSWQCRTSIAFPARSAKGINFPFETIPGDWPIQYLFEPQENSDALFVVFPALAPEFEYRINYHRVLRGAPVNQLFVLDDFGPQGSYLIASNGKLELAEAVCALIESFRVKLGIEKSKVIFLGSSKGGASALYFANRLGYGHVLTGAPQTRIGHFLLRQDLENGPRLANYMMPGEDSEEKLDKLIFDLPFNRDVSCRIHVGRGDHHYESHALPYAEHIRTQGGCVEVDVGEYSEHSDLGKHFPLFIENKLRNIFGIKMRRYFPGPAPTLTVSAWREGDEVVSQITLPEGWSSEPVEYAFYLLVNDEKKAVRWYDESPTVRFAWPHDIDLQDASVRGFAREIGSPDYKLATTTKIEMALLT
ncbi:heparinase II/III domain-containing protein [Caballeronia insecticola]|uniref:Conserved domain protein n=1 Tax=Caballeronia insecticola TaxID=758793 RepID=A0A060PQX0_9BURK|nr:heparinase II/III family protein [Caballeronia insecticola]BAO94064.1 conserved domain protein [Caballeronia insecticola]